MVEGIETILPKAKRFGVLLLKEEHAFKLELFEKSHNLPSVMQGKLFQYLFAKCRASIQRVDHVY